MHLNDRYKDFFVTKCIDLAEIQATLIELRHEPTHASVLAIQNKDPENLFCVSFQTLPSSSNGAPHILEHITLCGSEKFPVKDPFFAMRRRSMHTFMNAMTGADFTCYPASSQVEKDFYNLFEVYLDATFFPKIKKESFLQEGHRLEFSNPQDPSSPLIYKGVVYNEMKGAMNAPDARLHQTLMKKLLPDLPYAFNYGGDPKDIPTLTYEELKEFHQIFYHPSNALFFFYGNLPLKKHLDFLHLHVLGKAKKNIPLPIIPLQKRFFSPIFHQEFYPSTEQMEEKQDIVAFAWLTCSVADQEEVLALTLLDSILMDSDASPLRFSLLESGFCSHASSILDSEMSEVPWIIICKGASSREKLLKVIQETLQKIVKETLPEALVSASLHQLEFSRKEIDGSGFPYGLILFFRAALIKQLGCNSEDALMIHSLFQRLREKLKDPLYLPSLINRYLLNNPHAVYLTLQPKSTLQEEEEREEREHLHEIRKKITFEDVQNILEQSKDLARYQKTIENQSLECLPNIEIEELPQDLRDYPLKTESIAPFHLYHHSCFTNQIVYADLHFPLSSIQNEEMLSFFTSILTEIGAADRNYLENLQRILAVSGGVDASISLHPQIKDKHSYRPTYHLSGKALYRNSSLFFPLLKEIAESPNFSDKKRIEQLLQQQHTILQQTLNRNAMKYAISSSLSSFSYGCYFQEKTRGLSYMHWLKTIVQTPKKTEDLIDQLIQIKSTLLDSSEPNLLLSCDENYYQALKQEQFYSLLQTKLLSSKKRWKDPHFSPFVSSPRGYAIASPVAFSVLSFSTCNFLDPDAPALSVATKLLENLVLHPQIREQGGAYGSGATYHSTSGIFYFFAFRDPHLEKTCDIFLHAIEIIAGGNFTEEQIRDAKRETLQEIDAPITPGARAAIAFDWLFCGKTYKLRNAFRKNILHLKKEDIQKAIIRQLQKNLSHASFVSFASKDLLKKEKIIGKSIEIFST